jgi:two-component system NtrC family sensor kinase
MLTAQRRSIRLLKGILVAAVALPVALFCFAAWQGYKDDQRVAEAQIERSRDVLNEHALKVFEAVERSIAEINEIIRGMSDEEIAASQEKLHDRLERLGMRDTQALETHLALVRRRGYAVTLSPRPFKVLGLAVRCGSTAGAGLFRCFLVSSDA